MQVHATCLESIMNHQYTALYHAIIMQYSSNVSYGSKGVANVVI